MSRTVAEAVTEVLVDAGVSVVFGLPGVHNLALFDALERSPIRTIVTRHEASAAYAADAVGRLTGAPGVCITTSGPGAANAVTAMGEAQASSSPLLHITTTIARRHLNRARSSGILHEHPRQRDIFVPVTKLARHVDDANEAAERVREALAVAGTPPQAPTYLQLPTDLLEDTDSQPASNGHIERPAAPTRDELRMLASRLGEAERPVIWVGSGGAHGADGVTSLAERLDAPIVLTHSAKRRWDGSPHPLALAHPPHEPAVAALVAEADLTLVLGSDLDGMMTQEFRLSLEPMVRVDIDPERASGDERYRSVQTVTGDAAAVAGALLKLVPERTDGWGADAVGSADGEARTGLESEPEANEGLGFVDALDQALGDRDAAVLCDMAIAGYWTGGYLPLRPGRRILYPLGWGTLGFALPSAIGAACVGAGRAVVICGDGGALFSIGELATIAQEKLDVTIIVQNDASYGMLRFDEERRYGRSFAVDLDAPDFVGLARSFGVRSERAEIGDERLAEALARSLDEPGPALLEVGGALSPPRVTSARWPLAEMVADGPT